MKPPLLPSPGPGISSLSILRWIASWAGSSRPLIAWVTPPYTRNVFQEAMRLYPPAFFIIRHAIADDEIGPRYGLPLTLHPR